MTLSDSFWSFARIGQSWAHPSPLPKPRRRTAVFTQQHIETIGGSNDGFTLPPHDPTIGDPRLPLELIVHIVLLAAEDAALATEANRSAQLLELARVNRVCHRAILSTFLLPDLRLYGMEQIRAFAISLDKNRMGIRALARSKVQRLTFRARSLLALKHGYGPALFDASQAQSHFEKELLPFVRLILAHCQSVQTLHLEGVPRGLERGLGQLSPQLRGLTCLMGHYGGDLGRDFWLPARWTSLVELQLHGPRFRFTPSTATTLAALPQLQRLALVVPMFVSSTSGLGDAAEDGVELDMTGSINPLQVLLDRCSTLESLVLVGHAERDYVGNTEKYRHLLRGLLKPRLASTTGREVRVELVTALRKTSAEDDDMAALRRRVHPCEVSAWMMSRAQRGLQWFDAEQETQQGPEEELDYWVESFEPADHPSATSTATATTSTSTQMSRNGSNALLAARQRSMHQQRVVDAIEAADMLSDDESSPDEAV